MTHPSPLTELQALGQGFDAGCSHGRINADQAERYASMARSGPTDIPVCKSCGAILCDHTDAEFAGLISGREG